MPELHDIVVPEPVSWMPATAAWGVLGGLLLIILAWQLVALGRRWRANRYRREALSRLDEIERAASARPEALGSLPELVKITALAAWPRARVAGLSGGGVAAVSRCDLWR